MRVLFIVAWLFIGLAGVIYHVGPGTENLETDRVAGILTEARHNVESQNFAEAVDNYRL